MYFCLISFNVTAATLGGMNMPEFKVAALSQVAPSQMGKDSSMPPPDFSIGNAQLSVVFDGTTGMMTGVQTTDPTSGTVTSFLNVGQNFYTMRSKTRDFSNNKVSGAYRLSPVNEDPRPVANRTTFKVFRGQEVEEVHQVFNGWITQIVRVYRQLNSIELDWQVGPIPLAPYEAGLEVISRFDSSLNTNFTFFTDANGRETLRRIKDYRYLKFVWN
jgi:lysosomal alpha-mannosidase